MSDTREAAMLIRELRDMVHSLCLERGSTANCHGLMEDASRWLREDEATGTEQDIPAASEWPDGRTREAAREAAVANARKRGWTGNYLESWAIHGDVDAALTAAVKASPVIPLADHHHALSKAVQAEHDRWVEKLREWIAAKRERNKRAPESYRQRLEGYAMALNGLEALLAEAKATEPPGRSIFEEPACTPYPRPDDVVAKATDAADERRNQQSIGGPK